MSKCANLFDICDDVILNEEPKGEIGENLRLLYKKSANYFLLKTFILKGARHPDIKKSDIPLYQNMMREVMQADFSNWDDNDWINKTFKPIADLLDKIKNPIWQIREKEEPSKKSFSEDEIERAISIMMKDIFKTWAADKEDPWFPVAAQVILSGDDHMDGENFLNVLKGLGAFQYKNITMLFYFIRCFIMSNPDKLKRMRKPFKGICEPMYQSVGWIYNRTAYYDVIFAEQLLTRVKKNKISKDEETKILKIIETIMEFIVLKSQEELVTPNNKIKHPTITCLPMDENEKPLCHMKESDWQKKADLGFKDYVPDTDTTFLSLSMCQKWIDLVKEKNYNGNKTLLEECEKFLNHPYVEIINEYQVGSGYSSNPATIQITKPLDYYGAVPIWFDKPFKKDDGRVVRETLGNEICPGHNMDILESILYNRKRWKSLEGENLKTVHRFLEFHYRAFTSGNFKNEASLKYYLPEIYTYYSGRVYEVYLTLSNEEKKIFDPENKFLKIREIAIDYCRNQILGYTANPFDAALAVSALCLLRDEKKNDGVIAKGLEILTNAIGEGRKGHPYKAYEWNRMRHPSRILVGSEISTTLFAMHAFTEAKHYLF
jgi:hypothetical protein